MKLVTMLAAAAATTLTLSACGAGGSEFATKMTAQCVKEEGQAAAGKCACQVGVVEKALNDKEKKAILLSMNIDESAGPEAGMKALEEAGITMGDMMSMGMKMIDVSTKAEAQCGK